MTKKEVVWREILVRALQDKKLNWTQAEIARKYGFSLSTVFNALKALRTLNVLKTNGRGFRLADVEKFLYVWATHRNVQKDVLYQTHADGDAKTIEGRMPPEVIFGAFSAYEKAYGAGPADYDKVYVYANAEHLEKIQQRFPARAGHKNLVVLSADPWLGEFGGFTPPPQTFADLWNLPEWYAKDFSSALKEKLLGS